MVIGDKYVATGNVYGFLDEGHVVEISNVNENGVVFFEFNSEAFNGSGHMSINEFEKHFKKLEENEHDNTEWPSIPLERIEEIMEESEIEVQTVSNNCTIVTCTLPSGFVVVETSVCANPAEYNEEIGVDICLDKITDKLLELETYRVKENEYISSICGCDQCCHANEDVDIEVDVDVEIDEEDEDEDEDCGHCIEYDCEHNPHYPFS